MTSGCRQAEIPRSLKCPWMRLQEFIVLGLSYLHCYKKYSFTLELRATVQSCPAVKNPAGTKSSAVMSLGKSSCVPPRGVTSPSVEASWGWEGWSCCYHDFTLQAMHRDSAGDRDDSDRLNSWHITLSTLTEQRVNVPQTSPKLYDPTGQVAAGGRQEKVLDDVLLFDIKLEVVLKISVTLTAVTKVPVFPYFPQLSQSLSNLPQLISSDSWKEDTACCPVWHLGYTCNRGSL